MFKKLILLFIISVTTLFSSQINWAEDFNSGVNEAIKQNKPILFIYSSHTCRYCKILEEQSLSNKEVIDTINENFIAIISYTGTNDYTPSHLIRPGTPSIWFLKPNGIKLSEPYLGALSAKNLLTSLNNVTKYYNRKFK